MEIQILSKQGAVRKVTTDQNINILLDPWLPDPDNPWIQSEKKVVRYQMVASLMMTGVIQRDEDLISEIFNERDANLILAIHLRDFENDSWYWRLEKYENYSVKSANNMIHESKGGVQTSANVGFWRKMWNLKIPPKIKFFLWRFCRNNIPVHIVLQKRCNAVSLLCPICDHDVEHLLHVFLFVSLLHNVGISTICGR